MKHPLSVAYFEYLRGGIKIDGKIDSPIDFCEIYVKYILPPTDEKYYSRVTECFDDLAQYFPSTGVGLFGTVLSDDKLRIVNYVYTHLKSSYFDMDKAIDIDFSEDNIIITPNYARAYYRRIIPRIKFNEDLMEPIDYCLDIGPPSEKEEVNGLKEKHDGKRLKRSQSERNNNQSIASSSGKR